MSEAQTLADYSARALRRRVIARFEEAEAAMTAPGGDHRLNPDDTDALLARDFKPAAVLIPVVERPQGANVILTQRTENLSSHSGQIAFPGGKIDPGEDAQEAAIREAHEEIGLAPAAVEPLARFGDYFSGSGYRISPVIALVAPDAPIAPNPAEVADIFEVPLGFLMEQRNHRIESLMFKNRERHFFAMPWLDEATGEPVERRIWGVTAGIIRMVQERLYG